MEVNIREAEPKDAPRIAEIHVESWRAAYSTILSPRIIETRSVARREEMWHRLLTSPDENTGGAFVIEVDGEIVGLSLTASGRDDDLNPAAVAELTALYFIPSYWGRGLGTKLQEQALDQLREQGFERAVVWVLEENRRACRFYEKTGWTLDKRDPSYRDFDAAALRYQRQL